MPTSALVIEDSLLPTGKLVPGLNPDLHSAQNPIPSLLSLKLHSHSHSLTNSAVSLILSYYPHLITPFTQLSLS
ncbi:unnamed protein product [Somion occarium]|uniref:Uncharacterized protein n=1 Tax=Somion occarium TaxID=3059160 RepID=A0ABP1D7V5_9APHY